MDTGRFRTVVESTVVDELSERIEALRGNGLLASERSMLVGEKFWGYRRYRTDDERFFAYKLNYGLYGRKSASLELSISGASLKARLLVRSLPGFVNTDPRTGRAHNARLLTWPEIEAAVTRINDLLGSLGLPPLRSWQVQEIHIPFDFPPVKAEHVDHYAGSFGKRKLRRSGAPARRRDWDERAVTWWFDEDRGRMMLYSKFHEMDRLGLAHLVQNGVFRFEVVLRYKALRAIADRLGQFGGLTVKNVLNPWFHCWTLATYLDALGAHNAILSADVLPPQLSSVRTKPKRLALGYVHRAISASDSFDQVASALRDIGYRDPDVLGRMLGELHEMGITPSHDLPDLELPGLRFTGFCGLEPDGLSADSARPGDCWAAAKLGCPRASAWLDGMKETLIKE